MDRFGYSQEWVQGRRGKTTAIFALATRNEVLICQQLYLPFIPLALETLLERKSIRKSGPIGKLCVVKKDQPNLVLKGFNDVTMLLMDLMGKRKKSTMPKVIRDLDFWQITKLLIAPENEFDDIMSDVVRWDKAVFSKDEVFQILFFDH